MHSAADAGAAALTDAPLRITQLGDEKYLWLLVVLEVLALAFLRGASKRFHGG